MHQGSRWNVGVLGLLSLIAVAQLGGCAFGGVAAKAIEPLEVIPAEYVPAKVPLVIVVLEPPDPRGDIGDSEYLSTMLESIFQQHDIAPLVPSMKVANFRSEHPATYSTMSAARIGKAVGAAQVVRVEILRNDIGAGPTGDMLKGQIAASVSVFDAASGEQLWPTDGSAGATITYDTPTLRMSDQVNPDSMRRNICAGLAHNVALLFYEHRKYE